MKHFRELQIWQRSHKLTLDLYPVTETHYHDPCYLSDADFHRLTTELLAIKRLPNVFKKTPN